MLLFVDNDKIRMRLEARL